MSDVMTILILVLVAGFIILCVRRAIPGFVACQLAPIADKTFLAKRQRWNDWIDKQNAHCDKQFFG